MSTHSQISQFNSILKAWKEFDFSQVYRENLGSESFLDLKALIDEFNNKIIQVDQVKNVVSNVLLSQFCESFRKVLQALSRVAKYDNGQFVTQKNDVKINLISIEEEILNIWPQFVAMLNDSNSEKKIDFDAIAREIAQLSLKSSSDAIEIEDLKKRLTSELEDFETKYKDQFQRVELVNQREVFAIQATEYNRIANKWLIGVIVTFGLLISTLFLVYFCFDLSCFDTIKKEDYDQIYKGGNKAVFYLEIFKAIAFRLLIISLLIYLINFCVKNYNAHKHNYTVNAQKANSLNAALILLERAKTPEGNDTIMTQAATSIFSHQPTGYNKKDPENLNNTISEKLFEKFEK